MPRGGGEAVQAMTLNLISIVSAIACVLLIAAINPLQVTVTSSVAGSPIILAAGSLETVSAYHLDNGSGGFHCGPPRCGSPGEWSVSFTVADYARLTGTLEASAPIEVWVG